MKINKLVGIIASVVGLLSSAQAVTVNLAVVTNNTTVGLVTLDGATVNGTAYLVSRTGAIASTTAISDFITSGGTLTEFNTLVTTLAGTVTATSPGLVRTVGFTNGLLTTTGGQEMGNAANRTYLFIASVDVNNNVTGLGFYAGPNVPAAGAVTFNPTTSTDTVGLGTSVFAAGSPPSGFQLASVTVVPEPSMALLGALGALGLIRRRR